MAGNLGLIGLVRESNRLFAAGKNAALGQCAVWEEVAPLLYERVLFYFEGANSSRGQPCLL